MKASWIKMRDKSPEMLVISDQWKRAKEVLVCLESGNVFVAILDEYNEQLRWIVEGDRLINFDKVKYWQPIETPNPILEELRANQNYYLNT